jgi:hypothetical protein
MNTNQHKQSMQTIFFRVVVVVFGVYILSGFAKFHGKSNALAAELRGVLEGMQCARKLELRKQEPTLES